MDDRRAGDGKSDMAHGDAERAHEDASCAHVASGYLCDRLAKLEAALDGRGGLTAATARIEEAVKNLAGWNKGVDTKVTQLAADMVTTEECKTRHTNGRDIGFRVFMAAGVIAMFVVAILK